LAYQVIARKWRPKSFEDVVGQNHITQTLTNALKNGRLPHALLFTGPRGTGKTSSARILAKALRCPNAVNFVPCNVCDSCIEISQGNSLDVLEIDGASNNGVDALRELRDTVQFMPSSGKYKVYIIDEVHMLSTSAFNALLKTLEEPPAHVVFIMATTEVQKIPQTILSRCQRFDFRRISTRQITEHLKTITANENVVTEEEVLWIIARQGDGSMRDSQSLLDQVITFANGPLTQQSVVDILGLTDRTMLLETLNHLIDRDTQGIMSVIQKLSTSGAEPNLFAQDLLELIRSLLLVKISEAKATQILEMPDSEMQALQEMAARLPEEDIHLLFDMTLKGGQDIPRAQDPRIVLEVALLRMANAPKIADLQILLKNSGANASANVGEVRAKPTSNSVAPTPSKPITKGHYRLNESKAVSEVPTGLDAMKAALGKTNEVVRASQAIGPAATANREAGFTSPVKAPATPAQTAVLTAAPAPKVEAPPPARKAQGDKPNEKWLSFVDLIRDDNAIFAAKIENLLFAKEEGKTLQLGIPPKLAFLKDQMNDAQTRKKLQGYIDSYWGDGYSFDVSMSREASGETAHALLQKKQQTSEDELRLKIAENPMVKAAQQAFNGQIKSVTEIKTRE
jgi:DNA polymerase-3 subunit gamma/tau